MTVPLTCRIEGNKWYSTGKLGTGLSIDEVFRIPVAVALPLAAVTGDASGRLSR